MAHIEQKKIRNFSIIAHIDHGKSTIADRILEETNAVSKREIQAQMLDSMDIERERGITIKLNAVELNYKLDGINYTLNLIDTPGHVDFSYEVSRSLAACEGAILVVDAAQGIEAQTLANLYLAMENNLTIIPVINKIDLPNADVDRVKKELVDSLGFSEDEILLCSGKTGVGIKELVEEVTEIQEVIEIPLAEKSREYVNFIGIEQVGKDSRLAWIAYKYYAQKDLWVFIYEANRDIIKHPAQVREGQVIRIPELSEEYRNLYNPELKQLVDSLATEYLKK